MKPIRRAASGVFSRGRMCDDKQRYSATGAKRVARLRSRKTGEDLAAYACLYCKHFHIGHRANGRGNR
jgi:hypothetical protein